MGLTSLLWSFKGRIGRGAFWLGVVLSYLMSVAIMLALGLVLIASSTLANSFWTALLAVLAITGPFGYVVLILFLLAVHVKRYHDLGRSGWWVLILLVPLGPIWTLIECGWLKGTPQPNAYGPAPPGLIRKQRRLLLVGSSAAVVATLVVPLIVVALTLQGAMTFFNTPTDLAEKHIAAGTRMRLGGLVKPGSLQRGDNLSVRFEVTDGGRSVTVTYVGILPDLFREGQGVVTEGALDADGVFRADSVLAKHDERYMPKEVAEALKKQGHWKSDAAYGGPATPGAPK